VEKTKSLLKHKTVIPPLRYQNNNLVITTQEKSELLATHLTNTFKSHNISPHTPHLLQVEECISSPLPMALPASPTSPGEVLSVIKKLKKNKSPDHVSISNSTVKNHYPSHI